MLCTRTESEAIPMSIPKLQDILQAQKRIRPYLARTPLHSYPAINELIGTTLFIKHENYQPIGAFKVRGGINLVSQLSKEERAEITPRSRSSLLSCETRLMPPRTLEAPIG